MADDGGGNEASMEPISMTQDSLRSLNMPSPMAVSVKANSHSESRGSIDATNNNNNNNNNNGNDSSSNNNENNNDNNNNNNTNSSGSSLLTPISGKEATSGDTIEAIQLETESDVKLESKSGEKEDEKVEEANDSQAQVSQIEEQDKRDQAQVEQAGQQGGAQASPQVGQQGTSEVIITPPQEETGDIDSGDEKDSSNCGQVDESSPNENESKDESKVSTSGVGENEIGVNPRVHERRASGNMVISPSCSIVNPNRRQSMSNEFGAKNARDSSLALNNFNSDDSKNGGGVGHKRRESTSGKSSSYESKVCNV